MRAAPPQQLANLGALLRERRRKAGLTQAKLAKRLGWLQSAIAEIEGGRRRLDVLELISYAEALGDDPVALFSEILHGWRARMLN